MLYRTNTRLNNNYACLKISMVYNKPCDQIIYDLFTHPSILLNECVVSQISFWFCFPTICRFILFDVLDRRFREPGGPLPDYYLFVFRDHYRPLFIHAIFWFKLWCTRVFGNSVLNILGWRRLWDGKYSSTYVDEILNKNEGQICQDIDDGGLIFSSIFLFNSAQIFLFKIYYYTIYFSVFRCRERQG